MFWWYLNSYIWCLFFTILTKEKQAQRRKSFPGLDSKAVALKSWLAWHFALVLLRSNAILADLPLINELVVFHQPIWKICEPSNWVHLPQFSGEHEKYLSLPPPSHEPSTVLWWKREGFLLVFLVGIKYWHFRALHMAWAFACWGITFCWGRGSQKRDQNGS